MTPAEPNHGFDDSRRLTGPNRWFGSTAVTLTPLGRAAHDAAAHARWAAHVHEACTALRWPDPQPLAVDDVQEPTLVFAAPPDLLFTATEVNEWAWERAAAEAGEDGFDLAQPLGDTAVAFMTLAARAAAEAKPMLTALRHAAAARGLPLLLDDEALSIGAGSGSRTWPLADLPAPEAVPWAALHDVPTALVTGSNGKTTTVRLLAAIGSAAGLAPGHCCTEGVVVAGHALDTGDYAGPAGARAVLRHAGVQAAILETARGGILRRGLAVARADVAVVTNISLDHLGEYGVQGAQDLAQTKLAVAHAVQRGGTLVLNADDSTLMAHALVLPHAAAARQALFALDHALPALAAARAAGGSTCGVGQGVWAAEGVEAKRAKTEYRWGAPTSPGLAPWAQEVIPGGAGFSRVAADVLLPPTLLGRLLLHHGGQTHDLGAVQDLPITLHGAARHNIHNAAAAALAAAALGWPVHAIRHTLQVFGALPQDNPGRLERWQHHGATVLIDYAHNPDGLAQLLQVARALQPPPLRLGLLLGQAGNRSDDAIAELATTAAAFAPNCLVVKELPQMLRGRALGEVPALLVQALLLAGLPAHAVAVEPDEATAALALLAWARPGDVVVLPLHTAAVRARVAAQLQGDLNQS